MPSTGALDNVRPVDIFMLPFVGSVSGIFFVIVVVVIAIFCQVVPRSGSRVFHVGPSGARYVFVVLNVLIRRRQTRERIRQSSPRRQHGTNTSLVSITGQQ